MRVHSGSLRILASRAHAAVLMNAGELGSVRKLDDADFRGSKQPLVSRGLSKPPAASPSSGDDNASVVSAFTFKADESTPPPPRLSTVLSGV